MESNKKYVENVHHQNLNVKKYVKNVYPQNLNVLRQIPGILDQLLTRWFRRHCKGLSRQQHGLPSLKVSRSYWLNAISSGMSFPS